MSDSPVAEESPHYFFDPDSPGWVSRRIEKDQEVLAVDVARVLEKNPDLLSNDLIRDLTIRFLRGEIKGRQGRKPNPSRVALTWRLAARYYDLLEEYNPDGKHIRRGGISPSAQGPSTMERIHEILAREFKLGGKENVRNVISSFKNPRIRVRASRPVR